MTGQTDREWAACGYALGQLSAAADRSKLRGLWVSHETARVVAQLFSRGAAPLSPEELLTMAAGLPGAGPSVEEAAARRFWSVGLSLWRSRVASEPSGSVPEITKQLQAMKDEGMPAGDLALEAPLRMAALTGWALPCVAAALPSPEVVDWQGRLVRGLTVEARRSLERLEGLERDFGRWRSLLPASRSDSRIEDTLVLLGTTHALTPRYVAETLDLTRQGAARLLRRLEACGIVRKATNRQRWIIYLAENVAGAIVPETTIAEPEREVVDVEAIDRVLAEAYAALDRTVKREDG